MAKIAWIGLGVMGFPMAGHLSKAGHDLVVYNRTTSKSEKWTEKYSGKIALTPAKAAEEADIVIACVGNDNDLRSIVLGENGAFSTMKSDRIFIDHTTTSASIAREVFMASREKGLQFIDAPNISWNGLINCL